MRTRDCSNLIFQRIYTLILVTVIIPFRDNLREPDMHIDYFCRALKTFLFEQN